MYHIYLGLSAWVFWAKMNTPILQKSIDLVCTVWNFASEEAS